MLSLKIWWGSALQHAMPVQAALNLLSAIVCVCVCHWLCLRITCRSIASLLLLRLFFHSSES